MDRIDQRTVEACNELVDLKQETIQIRVDNRNEKAHLNRQLEQQKRDLESRIRSMRVTKDLTAYKEACAAVFEEDGVQIPALAAARQAQLCLHVHIMTIMENQLELLNIQYKQEMAILEVEANRVREGISEAEVRLLNEMVRVQQEIQEFVDWTKEPLVKRKRAQKQKKRQQEKQERHEQLQQKLQRESGLESLAEPEEGGNSLEETVESSPPDSSAPSSLLLASTGKTRSVRFSVEEPEVQTTVPSRRQSTGNLMAAPKSQLLSTTQRQPSAPSLKMMMPSRPSSLSKISIH